MATDFTNKTSSADKSSTKAKEKHFKSISEPFLYIFKKINSRKESESSNLVSG